MKKYLNYSVEDFIIDEDFQLWVIRPDKQSSLLWETFASHNPEKKQVMEEARIVLLGLRVEEEEISADRLEASRKPILEAYRKANEKPISRRINLFGEVRNKNFVYKIAAIFIGIFLFAALIYNGLHRLQTVTHKTAAGETKDIKLPDGSRVILNGNSSIRYSNNWKADHTREIWLDGEAYFSVTHKQNNKKFIVRTSYLNVEVLGTKFNVLKRKDKTRVTLNSGKIQLSYRGENNSSNKVIMKPGELVQIEEGKSGIVKKSINPQIYSSWKDKKLIFDNTTLSELATIVYDTYGLKMEIKDLELRKQRVTGEFEIGDLDILLKFLRKSFHVEIVRKNDRMIELKNDRMIELKNDRIAPLKGGSDIFNF